MLAMLLAGGIEINVGESVDWLAYDADRIVVAVFLSERDGSMTLDVVETLKGADAETLTIAVAANQRRGIEAAFYDRKTRAVVFLSEPKTGLALRAGMQPSVVLLDGEPKIGLFDAECDEHLEAEAILKATKAAIEACAKEKPASVRIDAPSGSAVFARLYAGSSVELVVPVDARLAERAVAWIAVADVRTRVQGARILGHFKSDENVERLKALLEDPGASLTVEFDGTRTTEYRAFPVRAAAYEALRAWGIDVAKPVIQEPID